MSLVTAQGIQARDMLGDKIQKVSIELQEYLGEVGTAAPSAIMEHFSDIKADVVREAMWRLLDQRLAEITETRHLRRVDG
ncbi:hypothetical protein [Arthrobacter globiformis]|uniref:hypothetical protein n=1 Tax=Arthrobacter globiformis TaxID=1665 RepID=UPI001125121B|nr:hypothetical protein [Arthrobacter globiformis]